MSDQSVAPAPAPAPAPEPAAAPDAAAVAAAIAPAPTAWAYAENVPGIGDAPEWFKADKYKTVQAQAEAYIGLESKLGSFTGAPEEYALNISQELTDAGIEFDSEDVMVSQFKELATKMGINQEGTF